MAVGVAIDGAPEKDIAGVAIFIPLPVLGNEVGVLEQVVQNIRVQDRLTKELLAQLVTPDVLPVLLVGVNVQLHQSRGKIELATLPVLKDLPAGWNVWVGIAVDEMPERRDDCVTKQHLTELGESTTL